MIVHSLIIQVLVNGVAVKMVLLADIITISVVMVVVVPEYVLVDIMHVLLLQITVAVYLLVLVILSDVTVIAHMVAHIVVLLVLDVANQRMPVLVVYVVRRVVPLPTLNVTTAAVQIKIPVASAIIVPVVQVVPLKDVLPDMQLVLRLVIVAVV